MMLSTLIMGIAPSLTSGVPGAFQEPTAEDGPRTSWAVHAGKLYTGTGEVVENALITVEGGKIASISPGVEATRDSLSADVVTAGMVDASARVNTGNTSVEQSNEVTPSIEVKYGIDPFDPRWKRLARSGVTTAFIAPENRNVVGGLGMVLKTAGPNTLEERAVEGAELLCGAIGNQPSSGNSPAFGRPSSFYNRRPTTRMGVEWEWRKALFDAGQAEPDDDSPKTEVLREVLAGNIGLFIQAWTTQDIRTAIYLKEEMQREGLGSPRIVIDCGAEAWREPDMLKRTGTAVILPPVPSQGRTGDRAFMPLETPKTLLEEGIEFALSAHDAGSASERLDVQAGFAIRGGLTREQALQAVTSTPAKILGVAERVGTVEAGKDADLVLWNGEPFEITTRPVGVLVGGELVLDPR